jgi:hypothetical protein
MPKHDWNWDLTDEEEMAPNANQCTREGWALVNEGTNEARIEKIDVLGVLAGDGDAFDLVARAAATGSEYHAAALEHIRTHNEDEWALIEKRIRTSGTDYQGRPQPAFEDVVEAVNKYAFAAMREIVDAGASGPRP